MISHCLDTNSLISLQASIERAVVGAAHLEEEATNAGEASVYGEVYAFLYMALHAVKTAQGVIEGAREGGTLS